MKTLFKNAHDVIALEGDGLKSRLSVMLLCCG
jgi:hypothetical protein